LPSSATPEWVIGSSLASPGVLAWSKWQEARALLAVDADAELPAVAAAVLTRHFLKIFIEIPKA
jgi:hypothetical protein